MSRGVTSSALRVGVDLVGLVSEVCRCDVGVADELFSGRVRRVVEGIEGVVEMGEFLNEGMAHVPERPTRIRSKEAGNS